MAAIGNATTPQFDIFMRATLCLGMSKEVRSKAAVCNAILLTHISETQCILYSITEINSAATSTLQYQLGLDGAGARLAAHSSLRNDTDGGT